MFGAKPIDDVACVSGTRGAMIRSLCAPIFALCCLLHSAGAVEGDFTVQRDVVFADVDGAKLAMDLYVPKSAQTGPLIVWVHGGAWRAGSKSDMPLGALVAAGYPVASVDYRLSTVAKFPAQVHDIKSAIRFLRAKSGELHVDAKRVVIMGGSAGGHLAALVGVTNGHRELEGSVGAKGGSSDVQGIVSFYGGSDLTTILSQSTPHGLKVRVPALQLLLGGQPEEVPALARLASPVFHLDAHDPPLLLCTAMRTRRCRRSRRRSFMRRTKRRGCVCRWRCCTVRRMEARCSMMRSGWRW